MLLILRNIILNLRTNWDATSPNHLLDTNPKASKEDLIKKCELLTVKAYFPTKKEEDNNKSSTEKRRILKTS
jgi:hypothetical protein